MDPISIQLDTARELVSPYTLLDVLSSLQQAGTIASFWIGHDTVKVIPLPNRRFDIAMVALESTFLPVGLRKKGV